MAIASMRPSFSPLPWPTLKPSRARVGFAGYFFDGWLLDHMIIEV